VFRTAQAGGVVNKKYRQIHTFNTPSKSTDPTASPFLCASAPLR
jgi:hypothetical protein